MTANEESGSQKWSASVFKQTPEDVSRDFTAVATAVSSPRPSVVFPLVDDGSNSQLQRLRHQVSKMLKGYSHPPQTRRITYNPEVLTSQKRQWARVHLQSLDHKSFKEPSRLFESMVVVGVHPDCDIQALRRHVLDSKYEGLGKFRSPISGQNHSRVGPSLEPQVLFVYPPEKQLPLQYKDILSFCIPHGVEVRAVERTPSMSELNEILLGQEYLKQSDLSFIFRLQAADNATLYGCCILVEEIANKPSRLISMISDRQPFSSCLGRSTLATKRCYCILSRLPYFELHFGVLNSILTEERLERLRNSIGALNLDTIDGDSKVEAIEDKCISPKYVSEDRLTESVRASQSTDFTIENVADGDNPVTKGFFLPYQSDGCDFLFSKRAHQISEKDFSAAVKDPEGLDTDCNGVKMSKQTVEKCIPDAVLPLLHYKQYESSESSSSFQDSPAEDRHFRSDNDEADTEETSFSGQEDFSDHNDILDWAKENHHGSLQIICEYYRLSCPQRGSSIIFQPLEHLQPLEFQRPDEKVLHIAGSSLDLRSCSTSFEIAEVHSALMAEEEATALSAWAISSICGNLRLENVLTMFSAALLEKQIVIVCSNLGTLSASVLSIIPLIRPYRWQSLLMPILPNDMLDFLDAPVPYIVGIKSKASEVQSKLANVVLVDLDRNQVRSPSVPHLPRLKELMASLSPYHSKLVGENYLGKRRPVYDCTDVQVEAARGFLDVLRSYVDSLCYNLRSHTITNVQSNDDKVSLLLKESFIDSFPGRDRPFMKLFVDTQMFSVRTDLVLSFYQKE